MSPFLGTPDVLVVVSPSFPALLPAMFNARARRIPWVLWLQDILPDGAISTGYMTEGSFTHRLARRIEVAAYRSAGHVFVISDTFRRTLASKGIPTDKLTPVYNPATRPVESIHLTGRPNDDPPRILCMGNIGRSQGLSDIVRAFEAHPGLADLDARLVITGTGVAEATVRAAVQGSRVEMPGVLSAEQLTTEMSRASIAAVTQSYDGVEFNVPSKLMNYLAAGLPVIASVDPHGEIARLISRAGAGWITDAADPTAFAARLNDTLRHRQELRQRGEAGIIFAAENLTPDALTARFEPKLAELARLHNE